MMLNEMRSTLAEHLLRWIKFNMKSFALRYFWYRRQIVVVATWRKILAIQSILITFICKFHNIEEIRKW